MLRPAFVASVFVIAIAAAGCRKERIVETPTVVWRPIQSWSGHTSVQTESFPSQVGAFRIRWESQPDGTASLAALRVTLHSAISGRPLTVVVDHEGPGSDTNFVSDDPRMFFLVVESRGTKWTVSVDEGIPAVEKQVVR